MFNGIDSRLLGLIVAGVVLGVAEVGYQLAKRSRDDGKATASAAGIQAHTWRELTMYSTPFARR